jgi:hypothetical protein
VGSSTEKTAALLPGRTLKPTLALKGKYLIISSRFKITAGYTSRVQNTGLLQMCSTMERTLGLVHKRSEGTGIWTKLDPNKTNCIQVIRRRLHYGGHSNKQLLGSSLSTYDELAMSLAARCENDRWFRQKRI